MKTIYRTAGLLLIIISLSGCGFTGGCGNLCGGNNYLFNFNNTSTCCATLPW